MKIDCAIMATGKEIVIILVIFHHFLGFYPFTPITGRIFFPTVSR